MVNLILTAHDAQGHPVTGLTHDDFEVVEDGMPQRVNHAGSDDVPFNLVILLDLSGSTKPDRVAMMAAAQRFIGIAGDHDRVALYALAENFFHVIAPLTNDRKALMEATRSLPTVSGASPIYDMIALAYAEVGRFEEAIRLQEQVMQARSSDPQGVFLMAYLKGNLDAYRQGQPSRIPFPSFVFVR